MTLGLLSLTGIHVMSRIKQRAVNSTQKEQRRQDILNSARDLFSRTLHYDSLLMKHIAENIDLTKSTLYLYFKTKEEVFLALYTEEFNRLFDAMDQALTRHPEPGSVDSLLDILASEIIGQETFLRLNSLLHAVLEQNIDFDTALGFKTLLRKRLLQTGAYLETYLPDLPQGQGAEVLLSIHELMIGCFHAATPTPALAKLYERPDMQFMKLEFGPQFVKSARLILLATCYQHRLTQLS